MCPNCVTPWKCNSPHIPDYRKGLAERFWEHVQKSDGCWLWAGPAHSGYGYMKFYYRNLRAHRVSWELHHGRVPDGVVRHTCDTPLCVRPDHLLVGTHGDNVADRHARGRDARGERVTATCRLTADEVREIRGLHDQGVAKRQLAARYGVTRRSISHIVNRQTWKHVL